MFTGIVEELGTLVEVEPLTTAARLTAAGPVVTTSALPGDSIAVNGVCLTVVDIDARAGRFSADVMAETLARSSLGGLRVGDRVNLERAATLATRLGGHLVQGHVDAVGRVLSRVVDEHWEMVRISLPPELAPYLVQKGSIAVDGVSLTIVAADDEAFTVSLIPTTLRATTLGQVRLGAAVNLEVDVVAKHVRRMLAGMDLPRLLAEAAATQLPADAAARPLAVANGVRPLVGVR